LTFFHELKRRNVFKVAGVYVLVAWLLLQISDTLVPALHLPEWFHSGVAFVLILGFPLALIFAWAFEMTPDGLKKERDVDRSHPISGHSSRKLDFAVIGLLVLALAYFAYDKLVLSAARDAALVKATTQAVTNQVAAEPEAPAEPDRSIAVLAFENMSNDPQMDYLGDGIAEELMNALYHEGLQVASRTDAFAFKGLRARTGDIGRDLGVTLVLEGSVRRSGDQLRITAQLIKVSDGFHLWSGVYERPVGDLFDIQDTIVHEVSSELLGALEVTPSTADLAGTQIVRAYDAFMLGRYEHRVDTPADIYSAIKHYQEAIRLDPDYHQAYAALARAYSRRAIFTGERVEAQTKISAIKHEFEQHEATWRHDPGWWRSQWEISNASWDQDGMERALASGIRAKRSDPAVQNPVSIDPYWAYSWLLAQSRLPEDAIRYATVSGNWGAVAQAHYVLGEPDLAIEFMVRVQDFPLVTTFLLGRMLARQGRIDAARELVNEISFPYRDYLRWEIAFNTSNLDGARAILESLEAADASPTYIGLYHLELGDLKRGFDHLQRAVEQHDEILIYLGNSLEVHLPDHVRSDPRYLEILKATGYTPAWSKELCQRAKALTPVTGIEISCIAGY